MVEVFQYKSCWHSQQNDTRKGIALGEQDNKTEHWFKAHDELHGDYITGIAKVNPKTKQ